MYLVRNRRWSSDLARQRAKYKTKELTRAELVERQLSKSRVRFAGSRDATGFIGEVWFASFESPRLIPFRFVKSRINRLDWFATNTLKKAPGLTLEQAEQINQSRSVETINDINGSYFDNPIRATRAHLEMVDVIGKDDPDYALVMSNHLACVDVLQNYAPQIELENTSFVVPAFCEALNEFNTVQYTSKIEHFGEDIVVNGAKTFLKGANRATHLMVFVGTMVKERNGKVYKRLSSLLIPIEADGLEIEEEDGNDFYTALFDDVEINPDWVIGRIGYGAEYLTHLKNCQKLNISKLITTRVEHHYTRFLAKCQLSDELGARDATRKTVAKCHLDLLALRGALDQVTVRKGFTFGAIEAELNCCMVMARRLCRYLDNFNELLVEYECQAEEDTHIDYLRQIAEPSSMLLTKAGFIGFRALLGLNTATLTNRIGSFSFNSRLILNSWYYVRKGAMKQHFMRNPKMYEYWRPGWQFGEAKLHQTTVKPQLVPSFEEIFNSQGQSFAYRVMDILERSGTDINKDEHVVAVVAEMALEYFKLGSLYSELKARNELDEYGNILEKMILELEGQMINRTTDKYQVVMFKEENIVELAATTIPAKLESTRRYLPSPPLMIENHFIENQKFLTNVEKMKLLDQPKLTAE